MDDVRSTDDRRWALLRPLQGLSLVALAPDLAAGLTLAAIAIPEQMATARLGGFAPQVGLIAFVAATLAFVVFGSSRRLSVGADSTITPIFAASLAGLALAGSPGYAAIAAALALMVGAILLLAGLFRLGWIADLLSRPIVTGFLAGIALHIVISQAPAALGLPEGTGGDVYHRLAQIWRALPAFNGAALAITLAVFVVTLAAEKLSARIPGALIALIGATLAVSWLRLSGKVAVLGAAPAALPSPRLPILGFETVLPLIGLSLVIALVVMVQTAATTRAFPDANGEADVDRDYVGVGAASLLAGLFGAMPVNASPPRTAAVAQAGGRTQLGGLTAALGVLLLAAFGTGLVAQTPTAALAGVLLFVAQRIFRVADFAELIRRTPAEFCLAAATTVLIFALPIQTGVAIGIFLSLIHGVFTITRARLIPFERAKGTTVWWPVSRTHHGESAPQVLVMGFQAPLSFLNAYDFRRDFIAALAQAKGARLFVLEASSIVEIDFTAASILLEMIERARAAGIDFAMARLESIRAEAALERFRVMDGLGRDHLFRTVEDAIRALGAPADASSPPPPAQPAPPVGPSSTG